MKFPKATTRDLTVEEIEEYHGKVLSIANGIGPVINITGEDFRKHVRVTRKGDGTFYTGVLIAPIKKNRVLAMITDDGRTWHTSTIQNVEENVIKTKNSTYIVEYV